MSEWRGTLALMTDLVDLGPAGRQLMTIATGVTDSQLDAPTPCAGRSVRQLLGHVVGLTASFRDAAHKELGARTDTSPDADGWPEATDDWRAELAARLPELVAAWREPAAWEGMTRAGGVDLPGEVAGVVALDELVLHGWDLARATGQEFACDEVSAAAVQAFVEQFDPAGTPGLFGPAIPVAAKTSTLDRLVARSGRDPRWTPPA